jgi:hypothetical protein
MRIVIETKPKNLMRYVTAGDYFEVQKDNVFIDVCEQGNDDANFLISLHELIEWYLTKKRGIKEEDIMDFDLAHPDSLEPGDEKDSIYRREHRFAENIERLVAGELGIDFNEHNNSIIC